MAELGQKKQRNYLLDFWKVLAAALVAIYHGVNICGWIGIEGMGYQWGSYYGTFKISEELGQFYPLGFYTLGFFTFTTGYWLMNAFQKYKKSGAMHRGHDFEMIYRYTVGNYVAYMPIAFLACLGGLIYFQAFWVEEFNIVWFLRSFIADIWEFLGVHKLGFAGGTAWYAVAFDPNVADEYFNGMKPVYYSGLTWYLSAIILFAGAFFTALVLNEKFTIFALAPIVLSIGVFGVDNAMFKGIVAGPTSAINYDVFRLWGPAMVGLIAWYIIDALKAKEWSKKAKTLVGWIHLIMFVTTFVFIYAGYPGGMANFDMWIAILVSLCLIEKDWFTVGANKVLGVLPKFILNNAGTFSLGLFAWQGISIPVGIRAYHSGAMGGVQATWYAFGVSVVLAIVWVIIWNLAVKPIQKKLNKAFGLATPFGTMNRIADYQIKAETPAEK